MDCRVKKKIWQFRVNTDWWTPLLESYIFATKFAYFPLSGYCFTPFWVFCLICIVVPLSVVISCHILFLFLCTKLAKFGFHELSGWENFSLWLEHQNWFVWYISDIGWERVKVKRLWCKKEVQKFLINTHLNDEINVGCVDISCIAQVYTFCICFLFNE